MEWTVPVSLRVAVSAAYIGISVFLGLRFQAAFRQSDSSIRRWAAISFYATLAMSFFSGMVLTSSLLASNPFSDIVLFLYTFLNVAYAIVFSNTVFQSNIVKKAKASVHEETLDAF